MIDFQFFQVALFSLSAALVYVLVIRILKWIVRSIIE